MLHHQRSLSLALCLFGASTFLGCLAHASVPETDVAQVETGWLTHGLNYAETRDSQLRQLSPDNVGELGLAWYADTGTHRGLEATPLVLDGALYTTLTWSRVVAYDAATGDELWNYDPQVPREWGVNACCDVVNRGLAAWGDRLYLGTLDGRLIALERATGRVVWEISTIDRRRPYTITGAPRAVDGKIIIGNGGAEFGVRGYVSAYDAENGEMVWRFHTVPGDPSLPFESRAMAMAAETWTGDVYWQTGGGGTVWDSLAYDPELGLVYVGVGNGSPWNRWVRSPDGGDNLFLASIVALDVDTGEYVWHYQTTPAETWDYTATQHMILAELTIRGRERRVLMQAPKNGFFYVLDRETGELLAADPYVPVTWASHVDLESGRPVETENADHFAQAQLTSPAATGGHNWHPMAYSELTGLVYIPAMEVPLQYSTAEAYEYRGGSRWHLGQSQDAGMAGLPANLLEAVFKNLSRGKLIAWDPLEGEPRWEVPHRVMWNGGVLSTATGLVFQGTGDGRFVAYDGHTGTTLWEASTGTGVIAPPITYAVDGVQYLAIMAGWGGSGGITIPQMIDARGPGRMLVYRLGGTGTLPEPKTRTKFVAPPPPREGSSESVEQGLLLYREHCGRCHGPAFGESGAVADLRYMAPATHQLFDQIVMRGVYSGLGMVSFADVLSEAEAESIHHFLLDAANDAWDQEQQSGWWHEFVDWVYDILARLVAWWFS